MLLLRAGRLQQAAALSRQLVLQLVVVEATVPGLVQILESVLELPEVRGRGHEVRVDLQQRLVDGGQAHPAAEVLSE